MPHLLFCKYNKPTLSLYNVPVLMFNCHISLQDCTGTGMSDEIRRNVYSSRTEKEHHLQAVAVIRTNIRHSSKLRQLQHREVTTN